MRKKWIVSILILCCLLTVGTTRAAGQFDVKTDKELTYNIWCRHTALLWGSIVGEDKQVRVAIGWYKTADGVAGWHAQPQVNLGGRWYFFTMVAEGIVNGVPQAKVKIISMPKALGETWKLAYTISWVQFALLHNSWMIKNDGKSWNQTDSKKWANELNDIVDRLRKLEEADGE